MFILGACVFVAGGVGFEILGYYFAQNELNTFYTVEVVIEESSELLGQSIMIFALLSKLEQISFDHTIVEHTVTAKHKELHKGSIIAINNRKNTYV